MHIISCEQALLLLDHGWWDGLGEVDFRDIAAHLVDCPTCASKVRAWSVVDSGLKELAHVYAHALPGARISGRVVEALMRERDASDSEAGGREDLELKRFLERLSSESALRNKVARAPDRSARLEVLIALGREQGFRFTAATVHQTLLRHEAANDGALTDEQLEAVAGGAAANLALLQDLLGPSAPAGSV